MTRLLETTIGLRPKIKLNLRKVDFFKTLLSDGCRIRMLFHKEVRWLLEGKVLKRVCQLWLDVIFLEYDKKGIRFCTHGELCCLKVNSFSDLFENWIVLIEVYKGNITMVLSPEVRMNISTCMRLRQKNSSGKTRPASEMWTSRTLSHHPKPPVHPANMKVLL